MPQVAILDEIRIEVPGKLDSFQVMNFSCNLLRAPLAKKYIFDFSCMKMVFPFGTLVTAQLIKQFIERIGFLAKTNGFLADFSVIGVDVKNVQAHSYAAHVGFFKFFSCDIGKDIAEAWGSNTYYPIRKISVSSLHQSASDSRRHYGDVVEENSLQFAEFLVRENNSNAVELLTYSIREMMRNVVEHSNADFIWYCGQYYPTLRKVDIAILDDGVGVYETLKKNRDLTVTSNKEALRLALLPGITRVSTQRRKLSQDDIWANSGYGLYATSRLCSICGSFFVLSNEDAVFVGEDAVECYEAMYHGTAVNISISLDKVADFKSTLSTIIKEGSSLAKISTMRSNPTASMISRMLFANNK